jgi:hypothetical protein
MLVLDLPLPVEGGCLLMPAHGRISVGTGLTGFRLLVLTEGFLPYRERRFAVTPFLDGAPPGSRWVGSARYPDSERLGHVFEVLD